ncbi:uncharacterized protein Z519_06163 [Cladophialophora bantiana CBS 173.52]|uniref:NAD(P)-binding domain-containing protein n=1 Tax=Cladophialophora bantiana (strain ATCC 10958 / CBS 173.52 / CDC B-1940 / NIH 8579) TaxID=1442370 RepID=A0A0D2HJX0_CLAB1|nr:uncharacterized protein Z519_06163 [Cladophialophora bantiana CBS 173.52]KIW93558.1 hypothetical protein Z519_06163 [Cladophialophora bantiana CBS 173.52]
MAILLTGGTGKTSIRVASLLQDAKVPFLLASRRGQAAAPEGMPAVKFDWLNPSSYDDPFKYRFPDQEKISAVYLVSPEIPDPAPPMNAFIDLAVEKHQVKRFVLLAGNSVEKGSHHVGKVWQHLIDIGVEYCVVRATWFMEQEHLTTIKNENKLYTACGDGKAPFISATDIAAVAFRALTDKAPQRCDYRLLGPELLSYDEIAVKLSNGLGRKIDHVRLSAEDNVQRYIEAGCPEHYAALLTLLETMTAQGTEERMNNDVEKVTGRPPITFDDWVQVHKSIWR